MCSMGFVRPKSVQRSPLRFLTMNMALLITWEDWADNTSRRLIDCPVRTVRPTSAKHLRTTNCSATAAALRDAERELGMASLVEATVGQFSSSVVCRAWIPRSVRPLRARVIGISRGVANGRTTAGFLSSPAVVADL